MKKIIILHGWTKNTDNWNAFLEELMEHNFLVEMPKIPGLTKDLKEVWKITDYVNWLKDIVDKEDNRVILMGHSNGGRIALAYARFFPEKIEKLILIDSAGIYHEEFLLRLKRFVFKSLANIGKKFTASEKLKNLLYRIARESDYNSSNQTTKEIMLNLIYADLRPILSQIEVPTLIIWGSEDKITPIADGVEMNRLIKKSKLKIIDNAKHAPQFSHIADVASIISKEINN
jgi:pimeloyl-ACP methyl ester carboxylesterase